MQVPSIRSLGSVRRSAGALCVFVIVTLGLACSFDASKLRRSARDAGSTAGDIPYTPTEAGSSLSRDLGTDLGPDGFAPATDSPSGTDAPIDEAGVEAGASTGGIAGTAGVPGEVGGTAGGVGPDSGSGGIGGSNSGTDGPGTDGPGEVDGGAPAVDSNLDGGGPEASGVDASTDAPADGSVDTASDSPVGAIDSELRGEDGGLDAGPFDSASTVEAGNACTGHAAPIAYYPCEAATGTMLPDLSGNGNNATLATAAGYSFAAGKVGSALALSSSAKGYAVLPAGLLGKACAATIAVWVYINRTSDWQRIFDFGKDQSTYMFLTPSNSMTNRIRFAITTSGSPNEQTIESATSLPTQSWHHVAVVLGPTGGILYLDGVQVGANGAMTLRPSDVGGASNYYIGRSEYTDDPYLDGRIDELRIYDRVLSAAELQALTTGS